MTALSDVAYALIEHSDQDDPARPRIGEKVLADRVQAALKAGRGNDGGPTATARALVAVGIIRERVARAYKLDGGDAT